MLSQNSRVLPVGKALGTLRMSILRKVGLDGAQCAEHGLHDGRLIYGRPAGDGDAAARFERAGVGIERRLFAGCVRQVFPFSSCAGPPLCGCLSCASLTLLGILL